MDNPKQVEDAFVRKFKLHRHPFSEFILEDYEDYEGMDEEEMDYLWRIVPLFYWVYFEEESIYSELDKFNGSFELLSLISYFRKENSNSRDEFYTYLKLNFFLLDCVYKGSLKEEGVDLLPNFETSDGIQLMLIKKKITQVFGEFNLEIVDDSFIGLRFFDTFRESLGCLADLDIHKLLNRQFTPFGDYREKTLGLFTKLSDPDFNPFFKMMILSWLNSITLELNSGLRLAHDRNKIHALARLNDQVRLLLTEKRGFPRFDNYSTEVEVNKSTSLLFLNTILFSSKTREIFARVDNLSQYCEGSFVDFLESSHDASLMVKCVAVLLSGNLILQKQYSEILGTVYDFKINDLSLDTNADINCEYTNGIIHLIGHLDNLFNLARTKPIGVVHRTLDYKNKKKNSLSIYRAIEHATNLPRRGPGRSVEFLFHQQNKNLEHTTLEIKFIPESMYEIFINLTFTNTILNLQLAIVMCIHHLVQFTRCLISCPTGDYTEEDVQHMDISLMRIVEYLQGIGQTDYSTALEKIQLFMRKEEEDYCEFKAFDKKFYVDWQILIFDVYVTKIRPSINLFDLGELCDMILGLND